MKYAKIKSKFQTLNGVRPIVSRIGIKGNAKGKVVSSGNGLMTVKVNGSNVELMAFQEAV